jgi:hypothetical protein
VAEQVPWTLIASARLHRLDPEVYLGDLFRVLPHWPGGRFLELCPRDWLASRARLDPAELERELGALTVPPAPAEQPSLPAQQAALKAEDRSRNRRAGEHAYGGDQPQQVRDTPQYHHDQPTRQRGRKARQRGADRGLTGAAKLDLDAHRIRGGEAIDDEGHVRLQAEQPRQHAPQRRRGVAQVTLAAERRDRDRGDQRQAREGQAHQPAALQADPAEEGRDRDAEEQLKTIEVRGRDRLDLHGIVTRHAHVLSMRSSSSNYRYL